MNGCRSLTNEEIQQIRDSFGGRYELRNRALFMLGIYTGFRISELLSLTYKDVFSHDVRTHISVARSKMKGKKQGRTLPLNETARHALRQWIDSTEWTPDTPVFHSQKGGAINRQQAHSILKEAYNSCDLDGNVATHSMRKTFAQRLFDITGNIIAVKQALGHKSVATTQQYLGVSDRVISDAILKMQ